MSRYYADHMTPRLQTIIRTFVPLSSQKLDLEHLRNRDWGTVFSAMKTSFTMKKNSIHGHYGHLNLGMLKYLIENDKRFCL